MSPYQFADVRAARSDARATVASAVAATATALAGLADNGAPRQITGSAAVSGGEQRGQQRVRESPTGYVAKFLRRNTA